MSEEIRELSEEKKEEVKNLASRATQLYIASLVKISDHYGVGIPDIKAELPMSDNSGTWIVHVKKEYSEVKND